jgi:hypothetical protein
MPHVLPRLTWLTDTKINFQSYQKQTGIDLKYRQLIQYSVRTRPEAVLLQADSAQVPGLAACAPRLKRDLHGSPIYFVVGNPGCHHRSIADVQTAITEQCAGQLGIHYLGADQEPIALSDSVALIGHDGWADSRYDGRSPEQAIAACTSAGMSFDEHPLLLRRRLDALADEAVDRLLPLLWKAASHFRKVVLLTGVAPWLQLCNFAGPFCQYPYAPLHSSATAGFAITQIMRQKPNCKLLVLCARPGHLATFYPLMHNVFAVANEKTYAQHGVCRVRDMDE